MLPIIPDMSSMKTPRPGCVCSSIAPTTQVGYPNLFLAAFGFPAICVAWVLHVLFVSTPLATYDPLTGRLSFGNKRYQQLYDQANQFLNTRRSRLGI